MTKNKLAKPDAKILDIERARDLLENTRDVEQILEIRDAAKLAAEYQRIRGASIGSVNDALEIAIRAQRRFGQFLLEHGPKRGNPNLSKTPTIGLAELGVTADESSRCKKLALASEEVFESHIDSIRAKGEKLTMSGTIAAVSELKDYDSDEWGTPPEYISLVREALGGAIDLDPASNERAQTVVLAERYFTAADDGLAQPWSGRVFLNPPYSQPKVAQFAGKLLTELDGDVEAAICLVNSSVDTEWCQSLLARCTAVCFPKGRIAFLDPDGKPQKGGKWGQCFLYFGPDKEAFEVTFGDVGAVLHPTNGL